MVKKAKETRDSKASGEDIPASQTGFWTSLPGIMTALGGIIVAVTGLITALYTTGVIGAKTNGNTAPPPNTSVSLASIPGGPPSTNEENDRSRQLAGKWEITEKPSMDFADTDQVTWQYDVAVSGNLLTLTGRILAIDGDKNISSENEAIRATYVVTLNGLSGIGVYTIKEGQGRTTSYPYSLIRFNEDLKGFVLKVESDGETYSFTGAKM